ncbi:hypothetical protein [Halogeometricum limi]|uniref:HIT zinc finger n=1 Tax=Halogeometricum limi TaxID=555875 RepID=A0A1I6HJ09_9EURY|nr:hypothetical protein [Halogeometricum limi]SFR54290.1 HIT zinc finger [Halogeometricum limi]
MSVSGLCHVCEANEAEHTCPQCGTAVCDDHFRQTRGLCVRCVETAGRDDIANPGDGPDDDDIHRI